MAIEFLGEGAHRRVAFVAHAGDDRTNVARDIGIGFAPRVDQRVEIAREAGIGGGATDHADACSTARRHASTIGPTRPSEIGSAWGRERGGQYVESSGGGRTFKKK